MTTGGARRDDFDTDLERVSAAYRELPDDEPPAMLDQAVLGGARRAISRKTIRPWNFGWVHAVSTAALLVLGIALLMQRPEQPAPEPLRVSKPPSDKLTAPRRESQALQVPAEPRQKAVVIPESRRAAAPATEEAAPPKDEAARADRARPELLSASDAEPGEEEGAAPVGRAATAAGVLLEQPDEPLETERPDLDPEAWLQRILELQRSGEAEAFEAELAAFHAAWPDYPLPAELSR
jgi:hypothetical protein